MPSKSSPELRIPADLGENIRRLPAAHEQPMELLGWTQ